MAITIQGPDGASIDFPDETSEAEMNAAMAQAYPANSANAPNSAPPSGGIMGALKGASRALEANLPFVDRAVAAAKGGDYASNLATEQAKNARFAQQDPWTNALGGITASAPLAAVGGPTFGLGGLSGRVASAALPWGAAGALQGASSSPDLTNLPETAERAAIGGTTGGALGAAVPIAAAGVGKAFSPLAAALRSGPGAADVAKLGNDVTAAYQNVKDLGVSYSPAQVQGLMGKIASDAVDADIDPSLNPKATSIINNLQARIAEKAESGKAITLPELDKMRQFVNDNLGGLPEPKQARFGALIKGNIDDFIKNAEPQATAPRSMPAAPNFNPVGGPDANYVPPGSPEALDTQWERMPSPKPSFPDFIKQYNASKSATGAAATPEQRAQLAAALSTERGNILSRGEGQFEGTSGAPPSPAEFMRATRPVNPGGPAPPSLVTFLSRMGVKDEGGDLASMGFTKYPGLVRPMSGVPMDEARRAAAEAGYLDSDTTVDDLLDKLAKHATYAQGADEDLAARRGDYQKAMAEYRRAVDEAKPSQVNSSSPWYVPGDNQFATTISRLQSSELPRLDFEEGGGDQFDRLYHAYGKMYPDAGSRADFKARMADAGIPTGEGIGRGPNQFFGSEPPAPVPPATSAAEAFGAMQNARDLAMRQYKANALAEALKKGENQANRTGSYGNIENTTRQRLDALMENEPWSPDEMAQLDLMAHGTPLTNTLSRVGKLSPIHNALNFVLEGGLVGMGAPGVLPAAAAGLAAQGASAIARRNAQRQLLATILAGGKAPAAASVRVPDRAALAAALAARQQLPPQRNTGQ